MTIACEKNDLQAELDFKLKVEGKAFGSHGPELGP